MITLPLRYSTLKSMALSPLHFKHACETQMEASRAMRIGTATHTILLGGSSVVFDGTRRGKAWDAFVEQHPGVEIVTADEHDVARAAADAVMRDPVAGPLFIGPGVNERTIHWTFKGVPFRSTPDRAQGRTLVELKTARTAEPGAFMRDAVRRHYHGQLAVYREALASQGVKIDRCVIVAVETVAPYPVTVLELTESTLDLGYRAACLWLDRYQVCAASDSWPGYAQSAVEWDIQPETELDFSGVDDAEEAAQ